MKLYVLSVTALLAVTTPAWSRSIARPYSYKTLSPDGQHVFVMIGSYSPQEEPTRWIDKRSAEIREIRQKWTRSGMYRNDGSSIPFWTVDWYAYRVDVPVGGEHVIRYSYEGFERQPGPALGFYRQGELIRGYQMLDLMTFPWASDRGSWLSEHRLSDDSRTLAVGTETGEHYVFDVQTGEIVSSYRPVRYAAVGVGVLLAVVGWWLIRRRRINRLRAAPHE